MLDTGEAAYLYFHTHTHTHPPLGQVTEMQALIEAAPVPTFVAERVVRRIVHHWVFHSEEKVGLTIGYTAPSGGRLEDALPMLRRRTSTCKESS